MKIQHLIFGLCLSLTLPLIAQQNNTLRGKMLFLSSGKSPAIGVEISGSIKTIETANTVYTTGDGSYILTFPKARDGNRVNLVIGNEDQEGMDIEVVNEREIDICQIPADASDEFEIIVCRKGARDLAAQKYYRIIKTSSDVALARIKKEMDGLLDQKEKDYKLITEYGDKISKLEQQTDSLSIYREAFNIASINKDNASRRLLRYIQLLDEGKSIMEAREVLNIKGAASDLDQGMTLFKAAIEELETRAGASASIFDYDDAVTCYDTIISYSERMGIDPLIIARYNNIIATVFHKDGKYHKSLAYEHKSITTREKILDPKHPHLANSYNNIAITYRALGKYETAMEYQLKAITIGEEVLDPKTRKLAILFKDIALTYLYMGKYETAMEYQLKAITIGEEILDPKHPDLAIFYNDIALTYQYLEEYVTALEYQIEAIDIMEETLDPRHPNLATSFDNIGLTLLYLREHNSALEYQQKAISIREEVLGPEHPSLAYSYNNIARTYRYLVKYERAMEYQQKTIAIFEKILDPRHPDLATSYSNIANLYGNLRKYETALEYQLKAVTIKEEALDAKHPSLAKSYGNIALIYLDLGQYETALKHQQKVVDILYEALPENNKDRKWAAKNWMKINYAKGVDALKRKDYASALKDFMAIRKYSDEDVVTKLKMDEKTKSIQNAKKFIEILDKLEKQ